MRIRDDVAANQDEGHLLILSPSGWNSVETATSSWTAMSSRRWLIELSPRASFVTFGIVVKRSGALCGTRPRSSRYIVRYKISVATSKQQIPITARAMARLSPPRDSEAHGNHFPMISAPAVIRPDAPGESRGRSSGQRGVAAPLLLFVET